MAFANDLVAILLSGIPAGVIPGFQNASKKGVIGDLMRLNVAVPPSSEPNKYGILGGDLAGYPNGRRLTDDAASISLRAVAGATLPLVEPSYEPDAAAGLLEQGLEPLPTRAQAHFPLRRHPAQRIRRAVGNKLRSPTRWTAMATATLTSTLTTMGRAERITPPAPTLSP